MISPALNTTGKNVQQEIDYERKEKLAFTTTTNINNKESHDDDLPTKKEIRGRKEAITFEVTHTHTHTHTQFIKIYAKLYIFIRTHGTSVLSIRFNAF